MKPVVYSKRKHEQDGTEWFRGGDNISYTMNNINRYDNENGPPKVIK